MLKAKTKRGWQRKCLPYKPDDLSLIPRIHVNRCDGGWGGVRGGGGRKASATLALLEGEGSGSEDMAQPSLEYANLHIKGWLCLKEQKKTPECCPLTSPHLCGAGASALTTPDS